MVKHNLKSQQRQQFGNRESIWFDMVEEPRTETWGDEWEWPMPMSEPLRKTTGGGK
jgi:hypothetical protein